MNYSNQKLKETFFGFLKQEIESSKLDLILEIILIGQNLASLKYVGIKQKMAEKLGLKVILNHFLEQPKISDVQEIIDRVTDLKRGLIFQLPVPPEFDYLVKKTPVFSDVDLLSLENSVLWGRGLLPPTIGAIDLVLKEILEFSDFGSKDFFEGKLNLSGKVVAVVGQGILVGGPLLTYLKDRKATILSLNSGSPNSAELSRKADILITAAGRPGLIDSNWVTPQTVVIDASTSEADGVLMGDVKENSLYDTNWLCGSPSGVGRITVLYLFWNLLRLAKVGK